MKKLSSYISRFLPLTGFTLIELLVVISILSVLGIIIFSIFFISFRGNKKAEVLLAIKQNGNSALSQMTNSIRYAKSLNSCDASSLSVTNLADNEQTTFSCPAASSAGITSNSASLIDIDTVSVANCSFTCSPPQPNESPTITIQFTLQAKNVSSLVETTGSIPFQTTVLMRNYQP